MASTIFIVLALAYSATAANFFNLSPVEGQHEQAKATAYSGTQIRWRNREVPYVIDRSLGSYYGLINRAIQDFNANTCVRFVPRTLQRNYVKLFSGNGCYHYVGMVNQGEQPLSLGNGCLVQGTIVEQLMGTLGFLPEQNRSDRDDYVEINPENIRPGYEGQFRKFTPNDIILSTPYDYNSIMHFGSYAYSISSDRPVIVQKGSNATLRAAYEKNGLSAGDIQGINKAYNCE